MTPHDRAHKGGMARAAKLTPAERSSIARKAVQARWARYQQQHGQAPTATVSQAQGVSLVMQYTERVYQPVAYPVASDPRLSRRTWPETIRYAHGVTLYDQYQEAPRET